MSIQVTVVGDGRAPEVVVAGDRLTDYDALLTIGKELPLPAPVRQTRKKLSKRIFRCMCLSFIILHLNCIMEEDDDELEETETVC